MTNTFSAAAMSKAAAAVTAGDLGPRNFGDPAAALPPRARAKLLALSDAVDDANAISHSIAEKVFEAGARIQSGEARLRVLHQTASGRLPEDHPAVLSAKAQIDAAREELARYRGQQDQRGEAARPLLELFRRIEIYLEKNGGHFEEATPVPAPELRKGETIAEAVARIREKVSKLKEDAQSIEDAPQPSESAKARARAQIEALAAKGAPGVMALIESATGSIQWPEKYQVSPIVWGPNGQPIGSAGKDGWTFDPLAFSIWLHKDSVIAAIEREITAKSDDSSAMDDATRAKKRERVAAAILSAEREEERLIELAEESGVAIPRREDADPRAFLGLSDSAPAPRS
ncbi:hypothetical protein AMST5_04086 [freshwater sediment metagenome]|uniref:Uncharacterized protein n=1 Tax=freshwater sediment metagenome TaxID=556182 RepID=A0AA48M6K2_9ZZZZ